MSPDEEVPAGGKSAHFAIGDGALQHPEAAVGVDPSNPLQSQRLDCPLDPPRYLIGGFDLIILDVDHPHAKGDRGFQVAEHV